MPRTRGSRRLSLASFLATCGWISVTQLLPPTTPLREAAAASKGPARGRATSETIIATIIMISLISMDKADVSSHLGFTAEPYVDLTTHTINGDFGALTPGAVATPRRYRPPASRIWWGGAWLTWTAPPRWGLPHGACRNMFDTASMLLVL